MQAYRRNIEDVNRRDGKPTEIVGNAMTSCVTNMCEPHEPKTACWLPTSIESVEDVNDEIHVPSDNGGLETTRVSSDQRDPARMMIMVTRVPVRRPAMFIIITLTYLYNRPRANGIRPALLFSATRSSRNALTSPRIFRLISRSRACLFFPRARARAR